MTTVELNAIINHKVKKGDTIMKITEITRTAFYTNGIEIYFKKKNGKHDNFMYITEPERGDVNSFIGVIDKGHDISGKLHKLPDDEMRLVENGEVIGTIVVVSKTELILKTAIHKNLIIDNRGCVVNPKTVQTILVDSKINYATFIKNIL